MSHRFLQSDEERVKSEEGFIPEAPTSAPNTVRVTIPSPWIFAAYQLGLTLAAVVAFAVFLLVSISDLFVWLFTWRSRERTVRMYATYWDKLSSGLIWFRAYYTIWRFSLAAKSELGYVDIPYGSLKVVIERSRHVADSFRLRDPWEILEDLIVGTLAAFEVGVLVYAIGLAIFLVLPVGISVTTIKMNAQPVVSTPVTAPAYVPSEIQRQENELGPWLDQNAVTQLRKQQGVNNIALLSDTGTARYSSKWTVKETDPAWISSSSPYVLSVVRNGTSVTFQDRRENRFTLNVGQPFTFENYEALVFIFDADGKLLQAPKNDVSLTPLGVPSNAASNGSLTR